MLFHGEGQLETIVFGMMLVALLQLAPNGVWPWLFRLLPREPRRRPIDAALTLPPRRKPASIDDSLLIVEHAR